MPTRIAVISLWAEDVPKAAHFYRDVIGLPLLPYHGDRPHFDLGGTTLVILKGRLSHPLEGVPERFPLIAFAVEDFDATVQRLHQYGVELPWGVEADAHSHWVMFHDPAGNLIEIVQFGR